MDLQPKGHVPMKSPRPIIALLVLLFGGLALYTGHAATLMGNAQQAELKADYGSLPLSFIENQGQVNPGVRYYANGDGHVVFLTADGLYLAFPETQEAEDDAATEDDGSDKKCSIQPRIVTFQPEGITGTVQPKAEKRQDGVANYFIGSDPTEWKTNVPMYSSVLYSDLYPGIDLRYYGSGRVLEYDLVVRPGGDPSLVKFRYSGVEGVETNANGDLDVRIREGFILTQKKPVIYQEVNGTRVERTGRFQVSKAVLSTAATVTSSVAGLASTKEPRLQSNYEAGKTQEVVFGFEVDDYDRTLPLIIDPAIVYTKYLTSSGQDYGLSISTDSTGAAYLGGYTWLGGTYYYARATKLNATGTAVAYDTTLGGSDNDSFGYAIALDSSNSAYLTGMTLSTRFPTRNAFQGTKDSLEDAFLTKLGSTGSIVYSTYLGGSGKDIGRGVCVDTDGSAYVAGETNSTDFPTEAPLYGTLAGGYDAFLAKFLPSGSLLTFATYLGGSSNDYARAVAIDSSKRPYVVGLTYSSNFPVTTTTAFGGVRDAFVTRLAINGASLLYSRFLGGSSSDSANAVAVDSSGAAYVTGDTDSTNFPTTTGAFQTSNAGTFDAFVTKISTAAAVTASTYLGGSTADSAYGIAVDSSGNAYVTGYTTSSNFPVSNAFQSTKDSYNAGFVTKLDSTWGTVSYSSFFLGATGDDTAKGIAIDSSGSAYIAGYTALEGAWSAFAAKIGDSASIQVSSPNGGESWAHGTTQTIRWTYTGLSSTGTVTIDLYEAGSFSRTIMAGVAIGTGGTGTYSWEIPSDITAAVDYQVMVTSDADTTVSDTSDTYFAITLPLPTAAFSASPVAGPAPLSVTFTDSSTGQITSYSWLFGDGSSSTEQNPVHQYTATGAYTVRLTVTGPGGSDTATKTNYINVGSIVMASPVGGEAWATGSSKTIRWTYTGDPGTLVMIELLKGGSWLQTLTTSTSTGSSGSGSYTWSIPSTGLAVGSDYQIRVTSVSTPGFTATSPNYFSITGPGPVANFSGTPTSGSPPLTVAFTDTSTGTPTSWLWDFGDGSTSTLQNPTHVYRIAGSYAVTLTVTNAGGSNSKSVSGYITVTGVAPVADFTATPVEGRAPLDVTFTDTSTGSISSWLWDFGDGTTSTAQNPTHTYSKAGMYTVRLTVSGSLGSSSREVTDLVTAEGINVTSPNGGETWAVGSTYDITWEYTGDPGSTVRIRLFEAGSVVGDIVTSTSSGSGGTGSYSWTIPEGRTPASDYKVRVISRTDTTMADSSDANFTISPAIVANFSGTPTSGTPPLSVTFTDSSTGNVTGWLWNFGDGTTSTVQNPTHVYRVSGTYSVTLTATGPAGSGSYTRTNYITVSAATPSVSFSGTPLSGSAPLDVQFTDTSTGSITSWAWTFGDGGTSSVQHPLHTYTTAGTYSVTLTVTGSLGTQSLTRTSYITVSAAVAPVANFTGTPTSGAAPLDVQFTDASTGNITSWSWDFGDGTTSTETSPLHTFRIAGTYTVKLTVTGPGGSNTMTRTGYITVPAAAPTAEFSGSPTSGAMPLTVNFTDLSVGSITGWGWSFGDSSTSTSQNPSHTYAHPGVYTVALGVTGSQGTASITKTDYIEVSGIEVTAPNGGESWQAGTAHNITWNYHGDVGTLVRIQLYKAGNLYLEIATGVSMGSSGTGSYSWTVPIHTTVATDYQVRVSSVSAPSYADLSDATFSVTTPSPQADFTATPVAGVVPLTVAFTDASVGSGITGYAWTFGDGISSTEQNPAHTYTAAGTYTVSLTITWSTGTHTTTKTDYITVADGPFILLTSPNGGESWAAGSTHTINWTYGEDLDTGLPGPTVRIQLLKAGVSISTLATAVSIGTGGLGSFSWTLSNALTPASDYRIRVTSTANSAYRDISDRVFTVTGVPVADFSASPTSGGDPLTVNFTSASLGNLTGWAWTFGDGGTSTEENPTYIYATPGTYSVSLTVTGPLGSNTMTRTDYITVTSAPPTANFNADPVSGITPLTVTFTDTSTGRIDTYSWSFGDGTTSSDQNPTHIYTTAGTYTVALTVTGPGGTNTRTLSNYITVSAAAPVANFQGTPTSGIYPLSVDFVDRSTGTITSWLWNFGDSTTSTAQNPPTHVYSTPGQYTVSLTVTGPTGTDTKTVSNYITVSYPAPIASFTGTPTTGAAPLTVAFTDTSTGGPISTWAWDFGDGGTSTTQNPSHIYTTPGSYTVTMTATGAGGTNTATRTAYIKVPPAANFSATPTSGKASLSVAFTDLSTGTNTAWAWTFGDGGTSTAQNPTHVYSTPGLYTVTLTTTGAGGSNTVTKTDYIHVAPVADFSGDTLTGPLPLTVNFTDSSSGTNTAWSWSFGDGGTSTLQNPSHTYTSTGIYSVTLTVTGPGGTDTKTISNYIRVTPRAAFTASPTQVAKNLSPVTFTNTSTGSGITSCLWNFGDGSTETTSDTSSVTHTYTTAGTYTISLTVTGAAGSHTTTITNYITVGEIVVASPNGGETWTLGETRTISWTYQNVSGSQVEIRLTGTSSSTVATGVSIGSGGSGSYSWTIPTSLTPGTYRVRVFSTTDSNYTDLSDTTFTLASPIVTVTSPNASTDHWVKGETVSIDWTYTGSPSALVKIELLKSGSVVYTIRSSILISTETVSWTVPTSLTSGSDYTVRITNVSDSSQTDTSDAAFRINCIRVEVPNGGESYKKKSSQRFYWTYGGITGYVRVDIYRNGSYLSTLSNSTAVSNGTAGVSLSLPNTTGTTFTIRITSNTTTSEYDDSDAYFTLTN